MDKEEKDILIVAYPHLDYASIKGNTARGYVFLNETIGSGQGSILGDEISSFLFQLRSRNITFTFRNANDKSKT